MAAFATLPMDFSQQSLVQQENYPPAAQPQVYADFTGPFYHHAEMPVYTDYTELYQQQQHNLQNIQPEASFWHLQVPHSTTKDSRPLGSNGKPKRRRTATQAQRRAANVRERRRMYNLNESFDQLRTRVPTFAYEKRLSRIETLRLAITYISFLNQLIEGVQPEEVKLIAMPKSSEITRVKRAIEKDQHDEYFDDEGVESDTSGDV